MRNQTTSKIATAAALSALALAAAPVQAATPKKPAAAPAAPAKAAPAAESEKAKNAVLYLKVLISALQSDKVEEPAKSALVGCLYNNSLGKISDSMDQIIAQNPGKIHRDNGNELLSAMVQICGYRPQQAPAGTAPAAPAAPAPAAPAPVAPAPSPATPASPATGR